MASLAAEYDSLCGAHNVELIAYVVAFANTVIEEAKVATVSIMSLITGAQGKSGRDWLRAHSSHHNYKAHLCRPPALGVRLSQHCASQMQLCILQAMLPLQLKCPSSSADM